MTASYFTLTNGQPLVFNGAADRYQKNIAALKLLRQLQADARPADNLSYEERCTLAHYSAFGESQLLTRAFEKGRDLEGLITEEEGHRIKRTALTAFYTPENLLHVLWDALAPALLALPGTPRVLEPALGASGMFVATMPLDIRERAQIAAVELDTVSSSIAGYLHPDVALTGATGFEEARFDEASFDLVVSNVPFGDFKVVYPAFKEDFLRRCIHDFFIARSISLTRPGGLVAVLTSYGTLDKRDDRTRLWLAQRARLLTAIRIPQGFAADNSGTYCGTDILIFRRYADGDQVEHSPAWTETVLEQFPIVENTGGMRFTTGSRIAAGHDDDASEGGLRINRLFVEQPDRVVGHIQMVRHNGHIWQYVAQPSDGTTIADGLVAALTGVDLTIAPDMRRTITLNSNDIVRPVALPSPRVMALLKVYDTAKQLLRLDAAGDNPREAEAQREELHRVYDALRSVYGPIHHKANQQALKGRPELYFLRALETNVQDEGGVLRADKAHIFFQATVRPMPQVVMGAMMPDEALLRCLNDRGGVELDTIARYSGRSEAEIIAALAGRLFRNPATQGWETADEYLSGNVRQKLAEATAAAEQDTAYQANVTALAAVQPAELGPSQIKAIIGAPWIPASDVRDFIVSLVPCFAGSGSQGGSVTYHRPLSKWVVKDPARSWESAEATVTWGTARCSAIDIIEGALNGHPPVVYDTVILAGEEKRIPNKTETLKAQEKWRVISDRFSAWAWEDADRAERLCAIYNERFNSVRRRDFDGSHLLLPGLNRAILTDGDLRPHQKDAIWMTLQTPAALMDLPVGGGKTFVGLAWANEVRRLGLARRVLITVPNNLVEQWGAEANQLYPDMRVLVMSPEDFTKERRGEFLSRIATEDFDAVICAHTSFGFIPTMRATRDFIHAEVWKLRSYLEELRAKANKDDKKSLKDIEKKILNLETKLKEIETSSKKDDGRVISWEELGIDALFVDEAQEFKNLYVPTTMGSIPGVPKGDSKRAFDMRVKTRDILRRGGRVVFATGTPVMNSVGECFVFKVYLAEELLEEHGLEMFDAWARTFAEVVPVFEMTPDGGGFRVNSRLARFVNLPELFNMWYRFTFSRSREQMGLPVPALMGGKRLAISVPASPRLKAFVRDCVRRVDDIKTGKVDPREDNMLKVVSDGAKAALDTRMIFGGEPDPVNKIGVLADYVAEIYRQYEEAKGAQIIYCELGTPKR